MSRLDDLRHIAGLVGIGAHHQDALGVWHDVSEDTLAALIGAFSLPTDPQQAAEALAAERDAAPFGLGTAEVVTQDTRYLRLRTSGNGAIDWCCQLEEGGELRGACHDGEVQLPELPLGYHRLTLDGGGDIAGITLIVAPNSAYLPPALQYGARSWGVTTQLYGLRSATDWGIGDFSDLAALCQGVGPLGAASVGLNPLHALFAAEPRHFSPYSPSSRAWLDFLYIDVTRVPGFAEHSEIQALAPAASIATARDAEFVDYGAVAAVKRPVLEALYQRFRERDLATSSPEAVEFLAFKQEWGAPLAAFALFEALHEHFTASGAEFSWHAWPAEMRDSRSVAVAAFAAAHADRVEFFQFLQWQADRQLGEAARAGREAGLAIGLYRDLAVGANPHGASAWVDPELVVPGASIGAPPDPLSRGGQNWGLAPQNPLAMRRRGFAPFVTSLRANMRHAGVLRIDHVMSLQRLYWVPSGMPATAGAYVNYPFHDLLRLVSLESQRQRCSVIGEDLGTVPDGFRETMQAANVLCYRIFAFERRWDGSFRSPGEYPALAAASAATHDLPTLRGFWLAQDIVWRRKLGAYPDDSAASREEVDRGRDRHLLLEALIREGLLDQDKYSLYLEQGDPVYGPELGEAIQAFLARSPSRLTLVQLEDVVGEVEQANLPGTTDSHPNWRRRLSRTLEEVLGSDALARIAQVMNESRARALPEP
ncbi:MAG: 4-alpha-glucanotransferase [Alphaproteobacteria bacterium]|nr:4-alpha-glucanotransferase [Alphaproteobacteria bacterium]